MGEKKIIPGRRGSLFLCYVGKHFYSERHVSCGFVALWRRQWWGIFVGYRAVMVQEGLLDTSVESWRSWVCVLPPFLLVCVCGGVGGVGRRACPLL